MDLSIKSKILGDRQFRAQVLDIKQNIVKWSKALGGSTIEGKFEYHEVWKSADGLYAVGFQKFGKEYYSSSIKYKDGHTGNNPNDMHPVICKDGNLLEFDGSFDHVFSFFMEANKLDNKELMQILGCLMVRDAYVQDHVPDSKGNYKFTPNPDAIKYIQGFIHEYDGISVEAYLHYIDAIAQNEDVKYSTLGYDIRAGYGRTNNLLTYANLIAAVLGDVPLSKLCSNFSRPPIGVAPIALNKIFEVFPQLEAK